jgi:hypothetical protein
VLNEAIYKIILAIWEDEVLPTDWTRGILCPILKKGDPTNCSNYRGISLLNISFSNILFGRLSPLVESIVGEYQCGFRRGKSTCEQIFNLRQILEKSREFGIDLYCLFIDLKAAYDSISRQMLLRALGDLGIPEKLIRLIKLTLSQSFSCVKLPGNLTEYFEVKNGVRQGDALACLLFNLALEWSIRDSGINTRGTIFTKSVQLLAYADDIVIIARTKKALTDAFTAIERSAIKIHLSVNESKTKYMPVCKTTESLNLLEIENYHFERVDGFNYLGSNVNCQSNLDTEIKQRTVAANRCLNGLRNFLRSKLVKRKTKIVLYKTIIRPVLTYGSETWAMTKLHENRLAIFERKVLRKIMGAVNINGTWRHRYNSELYKMYSEADIINYIKVNRMKFAGHLCRMNPDSLTSRVFHYKPIGTRARGRPKLRWIDCVNEDFGTLKVRNWRSISKSRSEWKKILKKALAHKGLSSQ